MIFFGEKMSFGEEKKYPTKKLPNKKCPVAKGLM